MKRVYYYLCVVVAACIMASCGTTSTVPITGRKHKLLVSDEQVLSLSTQEYTSYLQTAKASTNATNTAMVKNVAQRLATAVENYLSNNGYADELKNFQWEFNLIQDNQVNAFCMPGGKIVVYEGILPYTQTEEGLAIVLGHEIAHAVAKHSAEQMSKQYRAQAGQEILGTVLTATGVGNTVGGSAAYSLYGLGSNMAQLHYSRSNESEADYMGLVFAALAGYNPQYAITFWQRMASAGGSSVPEFLSTHPSDERRISDLQKRMPEAMRYYQAATGQTTTSGTQTKQAVKSNRTFHFSTK